MNEDIVELAFETLDNHDVLYHRSKDMASKALPVRLRRRSRPDEDTESQGNAERRSYHDRNDNRHGDRYNSKRNDRTDDRYGDRHRRNEKRDDRPTNDPRGLYAQRGRRASSFDNGDYSRDSRRDKSGRSRKDHSRDYYDSESSVSPQRRNRRRSRGRSKSLYDSSSSSLISSAEDERKRRKIKIKDIVGAGLATVATINAASGLYSSMEAVKERHEKVREGKLSRKEAKRLKNTAKVQDLAAIGVAALSLKSVYSRWQETRKSHEDYHKYDYFSSTNTFVLRMTSVAHEFMVDGIRYALNHQIRNAAVTEGSAAEFAAKINAAGSALIELEEFASYAPDESLCYDASKYPGVVFEVSDAQNPR
ncbi:hypothetical protein MMC30_006253, partial [Trapelia coarctata]|nr:hypothetical protein [Trapelia coarctata]